MNVENYFKQLNRRYLSNRPSSAPGRLQKSPSSAEGEKSDLPHQTCVLFLFRRETLERLLPETLLDRIELYQLLGYKVEVEALKEEIPAGYIGLQIRLDDEGRPEQQEYLMLRTEPVVKTILSSRLLDPSEQIVLESYRDSIVHP
ncbi:MAG: hypothetical protein PHO36_15605 [Parabacteroides sp.]|nr:hypothetical protein [Parabacteroides sp.]